MAFLKRFPFLSFTGNAGKVLAVNVGETDFELVTPSGGGGAFTDLTDVPSSYTGESLKVVRVNAGETGLEFASISGSGLEQYQVRRMLRR